jgi:hypothetical protein
VHVPVEQEALDALVVLEVLQHQVHHEGVRHERA